MYSFDRNFLSHGKNYEIVESNRQAILAIYPPIYYNLTITTS